MKSRKNFDTGLVHVEFDWSDEYGECIDCGLPAAYLDSIGEKLCSVCAAYSAAAGDDIRFINEEAQA